MSSLVITPIPAFTDNYFWLLHRAGLAVVVDPGDAAPVLRALEEQRLTLTGILITHHHPDHIGGLKALVAQFPVPVYGPRAESKTSPQLTRLLAEGDRLKLEALDLEFEIWETPGHTLGHIAFVHSDFVLCGDTLFSAGCGRLFEGTPEQMHRSLSRLAALPPATAVYCTHEYTLANLAFAAAVEPDNPVIAKEITRVQELRERNVPSLPSSIGHERRINPFLRTREPAVIAAAAQFASAGGLKSLSTTPTVKKMTGRELHLSVEVFAALRLWKDGFRAPA